ncbi:MAG: plasmid mobilization protein, partial [Bryobacteraceae bacterium]
MATAAAAAPPRTTRSFAGLIEEYASPDKKSPPASDFDGLEDDVATLSYEQALKSQGRYRRDPAPDGPQMAATLPFTLAPGLPSKESQALPQVPAQVQAAAAPRKSASVTVRLTAEENDRLKARSAEAGLTVSAYLRSCALEVESLRAQVKEAVAGMRQAEQMAPLARRSLL